MTHLESDLAALQCTLESEQQKAQEQGQRLQEQLDQLVQEKESEKNLLSQEIREAQHKHQQVTLDDAKEKTQLECELKETKAQLEVRALTIVESEECSPEGLCNCQVAVKKNEEWSVSGVEMANTNNSLEKELMEQKSINEQLTASVMDKDTALAQGAQQKNQLEARVSELVTQCEERDDSLSELGQELAHARGELLRGVGMVLR